MNASDHPPLTCLFSLRTDPLGGGYTIVSNLQRAVKALDPLHAAELAKPAFQEGQFYDLFGVGEELKRFAVVAQLGNGMDRVRFTAKMIPSLPPGPGRAAMEALERRLVAAQERFLLHPGYLLIVNNITMAHGREPLGAPQEAVAAYERRLVRQTYMHALDTNGFGSEAVPEP